MDQELQVCSHCAPATQTPLGWMDCCELVDAAVHKGEGTEVGAPVLYRGEAVTVLQLLRRWSRGTGSWQS